MTASIQEQFLDAIRSAGLNPPEAIEADGKLHRFASNGKGSDDAGWYVCYLDGIPAGICGDWRSGEIVKWHADRAMPMTSVERRVMRERLEQAKRMAAADREKNRASAATRAREIWDQAKPAEAAHSYLQNKGVKAHGARVYRGTLKEMAGMLLYGSLIIPLAGPDDQICSLQFIGLDGRKRFLARGGKSGCYSIIGTPKGAAALCVAEGFATAASVHEATGYPVVVAFDKDNLGPVARALRAKFPDLALIVCADDDAATKGNPGRTKATAAARAVGALVAIPDFGANRPNGATDFNDMARLCGAEAVAGVVAGVAASAMAESTLNAASAADDDPARPEPPSSKRGGALPEIEVTQVTRVQANNGEASAVTPEFAAQVTEVTNEDQAIPEADQRPAFKVFDDELALPDGSKLRPGVWFFGIKAGRNADNAPTLTQQWVCSPLHIEAVTFDGQDNNYGRLLRFKNTVGRWREWAMPMELLRGAGDELRGELLAMGVAIDPHAKNLLAQYLQANTPKRHVHCALQVGWCDDSFVLPDEVIGPKASGVIFQSGERGHDEHTRAGTLAGWQSEIAARAVGNPLLLLAMSAAFAGPMLARCNGEGGGIHFFGDSSTGKTTAIEGGCSIWGGPNFRRSWRATANGMEGAAALFNDCLLALDEISECDPREVGAVVYMMGNGRGKQRASRTGNARSVTRWRCSVLSSGERTIGTHMAEGGHRAKAGQSVRLLDIPAARPFGAFDDLHGLSSGAAFADAIKRAAAVHYGHAGRAFLEKLTRDGRDFCQLLELTKALPGFSVEGGEGQDKRTAARFALLALAGELATEYGITAWPEGAAIEAAAECFKAWRSTRGRRNDEPRQILEQVSGFTERHGDSRFSNGDKVDTADVMRINRAGWWQEENGERVYLFTAEGMHEALHGFDFNRALDVLEEAGALPKAGSDGKRTKLKRVDGLMRRLYPIQADKLGADDGA